MDDEFDRLIESRLHRALSGAGSAPPGLRPRYAGAHLRGPSLLSAVTSVPTKVAVGLVAASLLSGGVALKTVATGTPNPLVWGHQVQQQVTVCKQQLGAGQHGIGSCVSDLARQHGQQERAQHGKGKGVQGAGSATAHPGPHGHP